jgi:clan AA aspartic protease (TIGR02281 family)
MKQFSILVALILAFNFSCKAQKVIQMEKDGGVYKIPCVVNGCKMKFIFDTGAASVCLSMAMAEYLYENDYLSKEDILGKGTSSVADGRIVDHIVIKLRDIEIAGLHLKNVKAVVIEGQKAPLLLGQTAIQELGRISIDGNRLTIHSIENDYSEAEIHKLVEQANKYKDVGSYDAAIECYLKVEDNWGLSAVGLRCLAYCYSQNEQEEECLRVCKRWVNEFEKESDDTEKSFIYNYMANSYYFGLKDYRQAILWYQKIIPLEEKLNEKTSVALHQYLLANCYYELQDYYRAKEMYKTAIKNECSRLKVTISNVQANKVKEKRLGLMFYAYAYCCYKLKEETDGDELMILSAKCGYKLAIKDCEKYKLNYRQTTNKLFE